MLGSYLDACRKLFRSFHGNSLGHCFGGLAFCSFLGFGLGNCGNFCIGYLAVGSTFVINRNLRNSFISCLGNGNCGINSRLGRIMSAHKINACSHRSNNDHCRNYNSCSLAALFLLRNFPSHFLKFGGIGNICAHIGKIVLCWGFLFGLLFRLIFLFLLFSLRCFRLVSFCFWGFGCFGDFSRFGYLHCFRDFRSNLPGLFVMYINALYLNYLGYVLKSLFGSRFKYLSSFIGRYLGGVYALKNSRAVFLLRIFGSGINVTCFICICRNLKHGSAALGAEFAGLKQLCAAF